MPRSAIVVTSISAPNNVLRAIATGAQENGFEFVVIGDSKSPAEFELGGCDFHSLDRQRSSGFRFAELCPTKHYARKNIGYLLAVQAGAPLILETDDDNFPREGFWSDRQMRVAAPTLNAAGWVNVYRYFSDAMIWPRGLPLDEIQVAPADYESLPTSDTTCPIQQGLADENPDVDAIYRLAFPLPQNFRPDRRVVLGPGSWCPFNSQNTAWWPEAYPLLYLPAHCSFRMTDIWRSFVAQRIGWTNGWSILFHEPNVWQERNDHSLMRDFEDEVPGYLNNRAMAQALDELQLAPGMDRIADNLRISYKTLVRRGWVGEGELPLLEAWLADLAQIHAGRGHAA
ncbi:MAG: STELLO glycosyltransferase family protein [Verrucomicrobiota bacterium]|nr:STELLO glycosyltransferase family protein [Verrucomicrobiota bacterium]